MSSEDKIRAQTGCMLGNKRLTQAVLLGTPAQWQISFCHMLRCSRGTHRPPAKWGETLRTLYWWVRERGNALRNSPVPFPHMRMWECCTLHCLAFPCPLKQRATDNLEAAAMRTTLEVSGHRKEFLPAFLYSGFSLRTDASDDIKIQVILAPSFSWQDVKGYCC